MSVSRHAAYNLAGSIIPLVLALATVPFYIHLIGAERYGVLAIAFLLLGYFGLFDLGLGRAITYRLSELRDSSVKSRSAVLWTAVAANLTMGLIGGTILWIGAAFFFAQQLETSATIRAEMVASLPLLALCLPVATLTGVLTGALQAEGKFLELNVISVTSTALFQLLPIVAALLFGPHLVFLLGAALVARTVAIAIMLIRAKKAIGPNEPVSFAQSELRLLLGFGGWILIDGLLNPLLAMVDRFAIGATLSGSAVTIYTVPYQLAQRITIFPAALTAAVFPKLATASTEERGRFAEQSTMVLLAATSLPVLVGLLAMRPFFALWIGPKLGGPAADVGAFILLGFWLNALGWSPFAWLQGVGQPDIVTKMHIIEVVPYLCILYVGLTTLGLEGAALAFVARNMADITLLTLAAGHGRNLWRIAVFAVVLFPAAIICSRVEPLTLFWNMTALTALPVTLLLSWFVLPTEVRTRVRIGIRSALA